MTKYDVFRSFLARQHAGEIKMTFAEIERVLGFALPPSAQKHRPWWSNDPSNNAFTRVWLDAGYETAKVDMEHRRLVFQRASTSTPSAGSAGERMKGLMGALQGLLQIEEGFDLSAPAAPEWSRELDGRYGPDQRYRGVRA